MPEDSALTCLRLLPAATWAQSLATLEAQLRSPDGPPQDSGLLLVSAETGLLFEDAQAQAALRSLLASKGRVIRLIGERPARGPASLPSWPAEERIACTRRMIRLLTSLLPEGAEGGVLTPVPLEADLQSVSSCATARKLTDLVHELALNELLSGRLLFLALEPAPLGTLDGAEDLTHFFRTHLLGTPDDLSVRAYLRIAVRDKSQMRRLRTLYPETSLRFQPIG